MKRQKYKNTKKVFLPGVSHDNCGGLPDDLGHLLVDGQQGQAHLPHWQTLRHDRVSCIYFVCCIYLIVFIHLIVWLNSWLHFLIVWLFVAFVFHPYWDTFWPRSENNNIGAFYPYWETYLFARPTRPTKFEIKHTFCLSSLLRLSIWEITFVLKTYIYCTSSIMAWPSRFENSDNKLWFILFHPFTNTWLNAWQNVHLFLYLTSDPTQVIRHN